MVRTWKAYSQPKPDESPVPNPVWPLWFAALSFLVTRRAGGLFVLGLDRRRDRRLVSAGGRSPKGRLVSKNWIDARRGAQRAERRRCRAGGDGRAAARRRDRARDVARPALVEAEVPRRRVGVPRRSHRPRGLRGRRPTTCTRRRDARPCARRRKKPASTSIPTRSCTSRTGRRPRSRRSGSRPGSSSGPVAGGNAIADGAETDELQWFGADEALAAHAAGEIELAPPQYVTLLDLRAYGDASPRRCAASPPATPIDFMPRFHFVEGGGAVCVYREDVAYDDLALLDAEGPAPPPLPATTTAGTTSATERRARDRAILLVGLGRDPQVRLERLPALRELLLGVLVGDGGGDDHVVAVLPVHRRRRRCSSR